MDKLTDIKQQSFVKDYSQALQDASAKFLADFCTVHQPKQILEIGTNIGFSGCTMLSCSNQAFLTTIEKDAQNAQKAKQNFATMGFENRVNVLVGDAWEVLNTLKGSFDLIFLDGPKGQYIKYLPILTDLLAKGGHLIADNVLFKGLVEKPGFVAHKHRTIVTNLRAFLQKVQQPPFQTQILHIGDGISVSKKV
jgi:predicted O-methyltransferase YrrM